MAMNVSVQYNGGFLPDIILLTQCYYHRGTRLNANKRLVFAAHDHTQRSKTFFSPCLGDAHKVEMRSDFSLDNVFD